QGCVIPSTLPITALASSADGNLVYLGLPETVLAVDATNPASPSLFEGCLFRTNAWVEALAYFSYAGEDYLAVATSSRLYLLPACDLSAPPTPWTPLAVLDLGGMILQDLAIDNRTSELYLYATGASEVLAVVNATNIRQPEVLATIPASPLEGAVGQRIVLYQDASSNFYALVGTDQGLLVFSVDSPEFPMFVTRYESREVVYDLFVDSSLGHAVLASGELQAVSLGSLSPGSPGAQALDCTVSEGMFVSPGTEIFYSCNASGDFGVALLRADLNGDGFYEIENASDTLSFVWTAVSGIHDLRVESFDARLQPLTMDFYHVVSRNCGATVCEDGKFCGCFVPLRKETGLFQETELFHPGDKFSILYCAYAHNYAITQKHDLYFFLDAGGRWFVLRPDGWVRWEGFEATALAPYATLQSELSDRKPYCVPVAGGRIPPGLNGTFRFYAAFVGQGVALDPVNLKSNIAVLDITVSP
ncbi:MAG: hypothetical protein Q9N26_03640, partial [Aquificota bacterium]|nr:hypothetical protein [Aquificota bacterium]